MTIPSFTKEDFLETRIPYLFISEKAKDPLEEEQLIQRVSEQALAVGVRNFMKLYRLHKLSQCS